MINQFRVRPFGRDAFGRPTAIKVERMIFLHREVVATFRFEPDVPGSHEKAKRAARALVRRWHSRS